MPTSTIITTEKRYGARHYDPIPVVIVKGKGAYVYDNKGKRYLDMMSAYSALSHGHCHPRLLKTLKTQSAKLNVISRAFYSDQLAPFLKQACQLFGFDKALPMNTGVEAFETAIKAARKWAYQVKDVPENRAEIIGCKGNFHGRTLTAVGLSSSPQYQFGFGPFAPGFKTVIYGDASALENAITPNTAAFIVEPIQGEAGIIVPPVGYLRACAQICKKHQVLMICDEIQTGMGRTGKVLAFQHEKIKPDAIILGKALGGGILPISLFLAKREVMDVFTPGDHGSTFGGNPLAAAVASTALTVMQESNFAQRAEALGNYFISQLKTIRSKAIVEIRGKGLLIGMEIKQQYSARAICLKLLKAGILTKETHETVIRFAPPLIITKKQIDEAMDALKSVLENL